MTYFPFFMDLSSLNGLIVGGGNVALRKLQVLLPYGAELTVAAPSMLPEVTQLPGLTRLLCYFCPALLEGRDYVIAATGDQALNRWIAALCRGRGILVNAVDDRTACSFLFPALVRRGPLSIGISTGGASPTAALYCKERIAQLFPEESRVLLVYLEGLRDRIKTALPEDTHRGQCFARLFYTCLERGWPLEEAVLADLLAGGEALS